MDLMQAKGFHRIEGESRMPDTTEHLKYVRWNNDLGVMEYVNIADEGDDLHITGFTNFDGTLTIARSDGATFEVDIDASMPSIDLPGDQKILFDENYEIGGRFNLKYDYVNSRILLTDDQGIFAKNSILDSNYVSILQYKGHNNLFINNNSWKADFDSDSLAAHNVAIGANALSNIHTQKVQGQDANYNVALGYYAGSQTNKEGSVFIGPYAGRLEPDGDKLYIGNTNYTTVDGFREGSLLYGEFANGLLYVNNRLHVKEEVRIGAFNGTNTPLGGMIQFINDGSGTTLKPQYYDNLVWKDFATGSNFYLTDITVLDGDYTFVVDGAPDITINIPNTYYPSSGNQYKLQLSNGDSSFIHDDKLEWILSDATLNVDGTIVVKPKQFSSYTEQEGRLINTGDHVYMYIDGDYKQLDNEPTSGEANKGENIGGAIEVYAGFNIMNKNLQFYTLNSIDPRIDIIQNTSSNTIDIDMDYTISLTDAGSTGIGVTKGITGATNSSNTDIAIKRLHSSDSSVVITSYSDYIDLQATGAGGGEVNDGENVGLGEGLIYDSSNGKNGLLIPFRTIKQGTNITVSTDTINRIISLDVPNLVDNAANITGGTVSVYRDYTETDNKRTLNFKQLKGSNGVSVTSVNDVIDIAILDSISIPDISGIPIPVWTTTNRSLTWSLSHDDNILDGTAAVLENIAAIKLGNNLTYEPATNTLDAIGGSGSGNPLISVSNNNIVRDVDGFVIRESSNNQVDYTLDDGSLIIYNELGWLAFEDDYWEADETTFGIVKLGGNVYKNAQGDLYVDLPDTYKYDAVLYNETQYDLHDEDNEGITNDPPVIDGDPVEEVNVRRARARANIGAAYVNGAANESFTAASLNVNKPNPDGGAGVRIADNYIRSDWDSVRVLKTNSATPTDTSEVTEIAISEGNVNITLDGRSLPGGVGDINFYMYNSSGSKVKVAAIQGRYEDGELVSDFKVKGNIKFHCTDAEMNS